MALTAGQWIQLGSGLFTAVAAVATVVAAKAANSAARASRDSVRIATEARQEELRLREVERRIEILRVISALKSAIEHTDMPQYRVEVGRRQDELLALLAGTEYDIPAIERFAEGELHLAQDAVNQAIALVREGRDQLASDVATRQATD